MQLIEKVKSQISNFQYNKGYTPPLLITGILVAAHLSFGILENYTKLGIAIGASMVTELVLHRVLLGEWRNLNSAYISGISVGILIRSPFLWPYALCSALSIASKYVLRYKGTHIWNPSNFGIVAILVLAYEDVSILSIQWGNNMWPMLVIWIIGFVSIWRLKRFHICFTYVVGFLGFAYLRSVISGDPFLAEIAPISGPMYQLFVLFMITDPVTTVKSKKGQYLVAFLIAAVEMIFRMNEAVYAPFYALFLVGPAAMIIEKWWKEKQRREATKSSIPAQQEDAAYSRVENS
ncbi:MAG: RnfABCDGE type electron transport complex subunit D [Balneolaceae bacterium]|nr:RnfABCDGE type electron transport complex subunit D [Balneolaceae bacterium]